MFREKYIKLNNYIKPSEELVNKVKNFSDEEVIKKDKKIKNIMLKPAIAIMILVMVFFSMPVLASNIPSIYNLMYLVSPKIAQYFIPIQKSCENQGIKMEVISINIHENEAQIYITMQDLIGDRIDGTTDLNDSYSINRAFKCSIGHCEMIGFDNETKTATFLLSIKDIEDKKIDGEKITFIVNNFMSHKEEWNNLKNEYMNLRKSGKQFVYQEEPNLNINNNDDKISSEEDADYIKEAKKIFGDIVEIEEE